MSGRRPHKREPGRKRRWNETAATMKRQEKKKTNTKVYVGPVLHESGLPDTAALYDADADQDVHVRKLGGNAPPLHALALVQEVRGQHHLRRTSRSPHQKMHFQTPPAPPNGQSPFTIISPDNRSLQSLQCSRRTIPPHSPHIGRFPFAILTVLPPDNPPVHSTHPLNNNKSPSNHHYRLTRHPPLQ